MIVVDASAWVATVGADDVVWFDGTFAVPAHFDAEVLHALRGLVRGRRLDAEAAVAALGILRATPAVRVPVDDLLDDAWRLSEAVSAYDALYVALARREGVPLLTADARLARGAADLCEIRLLI